MKLFFMLTVALPALALGAPDEEALGKSQGYPICPLGSMEKAGLREPHCLVGRYSNLDEITTARRVARGSSTRNLSFRETELGADAFMAANRNTGLLVLQGDTILAERYQYGRKPEARFTSASMAKTVVAMLVGIAIAEKTIASVDDPAEKYVAELEGHPYGQTKLKDLLTMSSGVRFAENESSPDTGKLLDATLYKKGPGGAESVVPFRERPHPAGTKFNYASPDTQVLGLVLRAATGKPLADYLSEKIWQPMGAGADATWLVDASGAELGYCCINATLRDYARLGLLLANGGAVDGKQIVPADWVRAMTSVHAPHLARGAASRNNGYGYQTWLIDEQGRFALLGIRGQAVFVDPRTKLVVVHTAVHNSGDLAARGRQFDFFYATLRRLEL